MFIKSKSNYLVKVKINIGTILNCDTDEEAYVELRELDTKSMLELKKASEEGEGKFIEFMRGILPEIIVNHNLYKDDNTLMSTDEVAELIFSKMELTTKVIGDYNKQAFRLPRQD